MSKEEIQREIESLTKTVNSIPVKRGGRLLQRIAELTRLLHAE